MTLTSDQIDVLLTAGSLAPSGGNTQPWRVQVHGNVIDLALDPARSTSVLDVCGHAAVMALGSFAENVVLAGSGIGLQATIAFEDADARGLPVAHIYFEQGDPAARDELCEAIAARATNRRPHVGPAISEAAVDRLRAACKPEYGQRLLAVSSDEAKRLVSDILARADRVRVRNRALHREMFSELRWSARAAANTCDGIDVRSLHIAAPGRLLLRAASSHVVAQYLLPGALIESLSRRLLVQSSHLCTLVMRGRLPGSWFDAGRTLQRVWLTAEQQQLAIHPWTVLPFLALHPPSPRARALSEADRQEIVQLDTRFRAAFGIAESHHPFFVFRLFTAPRSTTRAPRRPRKAFAETDMNRAQVPVDQGALEPLEAG